MRIDEPFVLDFAYTRKMVAFLLLVSDPGHVLMVGLGGGSLAKFCHRYLPLAFADDGYSSDWIQLNRQAEALANRIPLDFPALLKRLRQGAVKK